MADSVKGGWVYPSIINNVKRVELVCRLNPNSEWRYLIDTRDTGGNSYVVAGDNNLWSFVNCSLSRGGVPIYNWNPIVADPNFVLTEIIFSSPQPVQSLFTADPLGATGIWNGYWTEFRLFDEGDALIKEALTDGHYGESTLGGGILTNYTWDGTPPTPSSDTPRFARPLFNRRPAYRR